MAGKKVVARKVAKKAGSRKPKRTYGRYIAKILKAASPKAKLTLSSSAARVLNSFAVDVIDRLATEAASVARAHKKRTLAAKEMQLATRLTLPAELAKHSMAEATKSVARASA